MPPEGPADGAKEDAEDDNSDRDSGSLETSWDKNATEADDANGRMYIDVDVPGGPEEDGAPHLGYVVTAPQRGNRSELWCPVHLQCTEQSTTGTADGRGSPHAGGGGQDGQQEGEGRNDSQPSTRRRCSFGSGASARADKP